MRYFCVRTGRFIPFILLLVAVSSPAQSAGYITPAISAGGVYDDNVFFSPDQKDSDFIARLSPEVVAGYESQRLTFEGLYTFDAEYYADNTQLNDAIIREHALANFQYELSRLLRLSLDSGYDATESPGELNILTLNPGRNIASTYTIGPALDYQFSPLTHLALGYTFAYQNESGRGVEGNIHTARTGLDRQINQKNSASLYYTYNQYIFTNRANTTVSHVAMLGWTHRLSPRTSFTLAAGPRAIDGSTQPEVFLSATHEYDRGDISAFYERTVSTVIGELGTIDTDSVGAGFSYAFSRDVELQAKPLVSRLEQFGNTVKVYQLGIDLVYKLNDSFAITGAYDFSLQDGTLDNRVLGNIQRNVIFLSIKYTMPTFGDRPRGGPIR